MTSSDQEHLQGASGDTIPIQPDLLGRDLLDPVEVAATSVGGSPTRGPGAIAWSRLRKDKGAVVGVVFVALITAAAVFAPLLTTLNGHPPLQTYIDTLGETGVPKGHLGGVSGSFWFGVEPGIGYDIFSRIVYGARVSLGISISATILTIFFGAVFGAIAGFFPGTIDMIISRFMDLLLSFPSLLFTIALVGIVPVTFPRPVLIVLVFSGLGWPYIGRLIRTLVLSMREREFVEAARVCGSGEWRIVFREILPNLTGPLLTYASLIIPGYIVAEAGLSFLGVGIKVPNPSWGEMLSDATDWYQVDPMYLFIPAMALFLTVFAFNLIGDGVAEAFNPKSRR